MKQFKIRCSAIGQIMTNSRSKTEILSQTAKSYVENWIKEQIYNRKKEFSNKYTLKGLVVEDNSIDFAADYFNEFWTKNEESFENDFLTGTPDIILADKIIDIKSSWDCFTFPLFESEVPNKAYYWQAQGYMELTDKESFELVYVLMDTPEYLIERAARRYCYDNGFDDLDAEIYEKFFEKMTYSDIPAEKRVKLFRIDRNNSDIASIKSRVIEIREYIDSLNIAE